MTAHNKAVCLHQVASRRGGGERYDDKEEIFSGNHQLSTGEATGAWGDFFSGLKLTPAMIVRGAGFMTTDCVLSMANPSTPHQYQCVYLHQHERTYNVK